MIVVDSSSIIALSKAGCFELVRALFETAVISEGVFEEVVVRGKGRAGAREVERGKVSGWLLVKSIRNLEELPRIQTFGLSEADAETIILAKELEAAYLLIDDKKAHDVAAYFLTDTQIVLLRSGSLLILAKEEGLIEEVKPFLDKMIREGVWISERDYERILRQSGEEP